MLKVSFHTYNLISQKLKSTLSCWFQQNVCATFDKYLFDIENICLSLLYWFQQIISASFDKFVLDIQNICLLLLYYSSYIFISQKSVFFNSPNDLLLNDVIKWKNFPFTSEFPPQRPVMRNFVGFFHLRLNKRNNRDRAYLIGHHAHYDVTVMNWFEKITFYVVMEFSCSQTHAINLSWFSI